MGAAISSPFSYWRSEATKSLSDNSDTSEPQNQPTCDPKNVNGHSTDSGDEDAQDQDGGNLDGNNLDKEDDEESNDTQVSPATGDEHEQEHCSVNGGENGLEKEKEPESRHTTEKNGELHENSVEPMESGTNGDSNPIILLNDIALVQDQPSQLTESRNEFSSEFEAAKAAYAARANMSKVIMGVHQRQSQLTKESRKRDHSADSDRSTPSFQNNMAYLNDLPTANRNKRQKSSETDSVSSRSDSVSAEIEQITSKVAKSRKRRTKAAKKYLS